jgi:hypothetical protein
VLLERHPVQVQKVVVHVLWENILLQVLVHVLLVLLVNIVVLVLLDVVHVVLVSTQVL